MPPTGRGGGGTAVVAVAAVVVAAVLFVVCFQIVAMAVFGTCLVVPALLSGSSEAVQRPFSTKREKKKEPSEYCPTSCVEICNNYMPLTSLKFVNVTSKMYRFDK